MPAINSKCSRTVNSSYSISFYVHKPNCFRISLI
jgi:hypothetical protein